MTNNARLSPYFKETLVQGGVKDLVPSDLVVKVTRIHRGGLSGELVADMTVALTDKDGNVLVDIYEQRIAEGGTLNVMDVHQLFNISLDSR